MLLVTNSIWIQLISNQIEQCKLSLWQNKENIVQAVDTTLFIKSDDDNKTHELKTPRGYEVAGDIIICDINNKKIRE